MKYFILATALAFATTSAFSHEHESKKKSLKHDKEHHHTDAAADHEHDEAHHKDHDHKAHHADHDDTKHGHDKDHNHVDEAKDHDADETHHVKKEEKRKVMFKAFQNALEEMYPSLTVFSDLKWDTVTQNTLLLMMSARKILKNLFLIFRRIFKRKQPQVIPRHTCLNLLFLSSYKTK